MSETREEYRASQDLDKRIEVLKELTCKELQDIIADCNNDNQHKEYKAMLIDFIIENNYDLKYYS